MTPDENSEISSIVTIGSGHNDDNHQDEDGRNELQHKLHIVNEFITVIHIQTCEYLQFLVLLRSIVPTVKRRRRRKRIRQPNLHCDLVLLCSPSSILGMMKCLNGNFV